jgi:MFS family permease
VVAMLTVVRTAELHSLTSVARTPGQVREGLRHAWQTPPLRAVLVILTIGGAFGTNFQVLLPLITAQTFGQGPATYGLLMGAMGIGSVAGSLITASTGPPTVRRVAAYAIAFGFSLAAVGAAPFLGVAFVAVALMGVGFGTFIPSCSAALQVNSADAMLGRIMALYTIAFLGTAPIGGPAIGGLAQAFGPREGFFVGAAGCIAAALLGLSAARQNAQHPGRQKRIFARPAR